MKRVLYLSLIFLVACSSEVTINTSSFNLKGSVKSITDVQSQGIYDRNYNVYPDSVVAGSVSFINTKFFDEDGKWTKAEMKLTNGTLYSKSEVLYDEDGNYTGTRDTDAGGKLFRENTVTEISSACIKMESKDDKGKVISKNVSEYEEGLVMNQTTTWTDGSLEMTYKYKRDSEGNEEEIEVTSVTASGKPTKEILKVKILETDVHGNWTRQAYYFQNNNKCTVIDRKIEYYK